MTNEKDRDDSAYLLDEETLPVMQKVAEGMPGGFFIYHADGNESLIYNNKALLRIFGCDTQKEFERLTGYTFKGMVHPDDYDKIESSINDQIINNVHNLDYVEYRIIQKDGSVRWIEDYGHFIHTEIYGDVYYVFVEDATERMQERMQKLEAINTELSNAYERERQYKKAILQDAVTYFEINLTTDEFITSATQVVNGQCLDLFQMLGVKPFKKYSDYLKYRARGLSPEELETYWDIFDIQKLIECHKNGQYEVTHEMKVVDTYGRQRFYRYTFLLDESDRSGEIVALSITKDVTDEVERQKLLHIALSEAQSASVARKTFLNSMSHDIRTPLNGIIGFMDLIESHVTNPDKIKEYLKKMKLSAAQLLAILTESMELTRIESGKTALVVSECNILDIIADVEKTAFTQAAMKQIHIKTDKSKLSHFEIIADAVRVKEILSQLLDNAVKYTPNQGEVSFSVLETNEAPKNYATYQFVIQDTGIGIDEKFRDKMFEPFERESDTTESGIHGTGLGLAVVKGLIDMMSGSIQVESEVNAGSVFTVILTFPLSKEQTERPETKKAVTELIDLKGKKVLLVEDNEINMQIAYELLTEQGMEVFLAENGKTAVDMVEGSAPGTYDIILMDIQMPVMNGYDATKVIRSLENPLLAQIPIIAVSANTFAEDQKKSLEVGMDAHFSKPIDIDALCELMAETLSRREVCAE